MNLKEDLQLLKKSFQNKLDLKNIRLSFQSIKIIAAIIAIFFLFSGLSLSSSKVLLNKELERIEYNFKTKNPELMANIIEQCEGNLYEQSVVQGCVDKAYEDLTGTHKNKLMINGFLRFLWFLFIVSLFAGVIYIKKFQKKLNTDKREF